MKERTDDWIVYPPVSECKHGSWHWKWQEEEWECLFCHAPIPFRLTEEEYEWIINLCSQGQA